MKSKIAPLSAVLAVAAAALAPGAVASPSTGGSATIAVQRVKLGPILVDGRGHALYLFEKDKAGKSTCNGACAAAWPSLIAPGKPRAQSNVRASLLGTTRRKDGRLQVTYRRHPLYTFVDDSKKGQTNGEGVDAFGGKWYLVSPAGTKVASGNAPSTSGSHPAPGDGGRYPGY